VAFGGVAWHSRVEDFDLGGGKDPQKG
jgi:serine/threonine protein kinase